MHRSFLFVFVMLLCHSTPLSGQMFGGLGINFSGRVASTIDGAQRRVSLGHYLFFGQEMRLKPTGLMLAPAIYSIRKAQTVDYSFHSGSTVYAELGTVAMDAIGLQVPLVYSRLNKKGRGIRLSTGIRGDVAFGKPKFVSSYSDRQTLSFVKAKDRLNVGLIGALHLVWDKSIDISFGIQKDFSSTFLLTQADGPVSGGWDIRFQTFFITVSGRRQ